MIISKKGQRKVLQIENPLPIILGTGNALTFRLFRILEYRLFDLYTVAIKWDSLGIETNHIILHFITQLNHIP